MLKDIYDVEVDGKTVPCYTCGHCSNIILLRADRKRERVTCLSCSRLICEKSPACRAGCTPIHSLAKDHNMDDPKWGILVPEVLRG